MFALLCSKTLALFKSGGSKHRDIRFCNMFCNVIMQRQNILLPKESYPSFGLHICFCAGEADVQEMRTAQTHNDTHRPAGHKAALVDLLVSATAHTSSCISIMKAVFKNSCVMIVFCKVQLLLHALNKIECLTSSGEK